MNERSRLITRLALLLVCGFLAVTVGAYLVSRQTIREGILEQTLPLTGDTIYSEIQKDILRPVFISSLMAHDTFLRDWILDGEKDAEQIDRYLKEVKIKYGTISSFFVSERSRRYYHGAGVLKTVDERELRDTWFFRVRGMQPDYEINVDPDLANRDTMTIFINHKVSDYAGNFIGATGVGLTLDTVSHLLAAYESRFQRRIYFVDGLGNIVLGGKAARARTGSIREQPGVRDIAGEILANGGKPHELSYVQDGSTILVNARHIPELNWYLIVEQDDREAIRPAQHVLILNLAISAAITLLVLGTAFVALTRYQRQLEKAAATDPLTGLLNRQAFDLVFDVALRESQRDGQALSAVLIDVDFFKAVNDTHGHLVGDAVLRAVADLLKGQLRDADVMARWGGEEFLVLLKDCPLQNALGVAEKLRGKVEAHRFAALPGSPPLTISLGIAQLDPGESTGSLFNRADAALYAAKRNGRNRVEVSDAADASAVAPSGRSANT
jgi:diguanylate cyclase (GGDEF)-like protein